MSTCKYVKLTGEVCGRGHGARYAFCAAHRPRPEARPFNPCASCGTRTRLVDAQTGLPLCIQKSCGLLKHHTEYRRRKRTKDAEAAAQRAQDAEEKAQKDANELAMDDYVADLIEDFTPLPPPPPPSWGTLSDSARAELTLWLRKVFEADHQDGSGLHEPPAAPISSH